MLKKKKKSEGFFRIFAKTHGFILYLPFFKLFSKPQTLSKNLPNGPPNFKVTCGTILGILSCDYIHSNIYTYLLNYHLIVNIFIKLSIVSISSLNY
jgi:hypothetical protein